MESAKEIVTEEVLAESVHHLFSTWVLANVKEMQPFMKAMIDYFKSLLARNPHLTYDFEVSLCLTEITKMDAKLDQWLKNINTEYINLDESKKELLRTLARMHFIEKTKDSEETPNAENGSDQDN